MRRLFVRTTLFLDQKWKVWRTAGHGRNQTCHTGLVNIGIIVTAVDEGHFLARGGAFAGHQTDLIGRNALAVGAQGASNGHVAMLLALGSAVFQAAGSIDAVV